MNEKTRPILTSLVLFFVAGICEIGGGYLVWLWLREDMSWIIGVFGGLVLFMYGIVPTLQQSHFHRVYAAYGGIFIVMSIFWGWSFQGTAPDTWDIVGTIVALIGVGIIFYAPREGERVWSKQ